MYWKHDLSVYMFWIARNQNSKFYIPYIVDKIDFQYNRSSFVRYIWQCRVTLIRPGSHFRTITHCVQRVHYQASVWWQAHCQHPNLPEPTTHGWKLVDGQLVPTLMSLPAIPESCLGVVSCSCTTQCQTLRCKCRISKLMCTGACKCAHTLDSCMNKLD